MTFIDKTKFNNVILNTNKNTKPRKPMPAAIAAVPKLPETTLSQRCKNGIISIFHTAKAHRYKIAGLALSTLALGIYNLPAPHVATPTLPFETAYTRTIGMATSLINTTIPVLQKSASWALSTHDLMGKITAKYIIPAERMILGALFIKLAKHDPLLALIQVFITLELAAGLVLAPVAWLHRVASR